MSDFNPNTELFGHYCQIPTDHNAQLHLYKIIGLFESNTWVEAPVCIPYDPVIHDHTEPVLNVIHCGIDETRVIRVALKDCRPMHPTKHKITVVIPAVPPSWNEFAGRKNCQEYRDRKDEWTNWVYLLASRNRPMKPFDRSHVSITYRFKTRNRRDPDNYSGKFIMDGLTAAGIIVDDSFRHVKLSLDAEPEPGPEQTTVIIEEL